MSTFQDESELTERRASNPLIVKEISFGHGNATILYNIPGA